MGISNNFIFSLLGSGVKNNNSDLYLPSVAHLLDGFPQFLLHLVSPLQKLDKEKSVRFVVCEELLDHVDCCFWTVGHLAWQFEFLLQVEVESLHAEHVVHHCKDWCRADLYVGGVVEDAKGYLGLIILADAVAVAGLRL